jgi:hypothetical protein
VTGIDEETSNDSCVCNCGSRMVVDWVVVVVSVALVVVKLED